MDVPPYRLLTSTRYDLRLTAFRWNDDSDGPLPFFLLPFHLDRLISAAQLHGWTDVQSSLTYSDLKRLCFRSIALQQRESDAFKIRITVSKMGQIEVATVPLSTRFWSDPTSLFNPFRNPESPPLPTVSIYIDTHPTTPSIFTRTKTTFRELYDQVKTRNQCTLSSPPHTGATTDVLMYNQHGEITETTIFNVAFYRDNQWLTPATSTGCLPGVMRRWLLETGRIQEDKLKVLKRNSIHLDEWLLLFNGVQGCQLGKLRLSVSNP